MCMDTKSLYQFYLKTIGQELEDFREWLFATSIYDNWKMFRDGPYNVYCQSTFLMRNFSSFYGFG